MEANRDTRFAVVISRGSRMIGRPSSRPRMADEEEHKVLPGGLQRRARREPDEPRRV